MKHKILKQYFGYDTFKEGQDQIIDSILAGRDTLAICATGFGKSLCFQIPALIMNGITIVISPLISLMKDQVFSLNQAGVLAAFLNSSLSENQYKKVLTLAKAGRYPIIYVAPERLLTDSFLNFAMQVDISMVSVDEAHCVSQWGQDFRPSYLKIPEFINMLNKRPIVSAFTATATKEVKEDIIDLIMLREPNVVSTGYNRPNLYLGVQSPKNKYSALNHYITCHSNDCGIIYCLTRKLVEEVSNKLAADGFSVTKYHAGLSDIERKNNQEDFIYDKSQIMVATNAFGMGIDKSNVRYVIHYNMPKNLESYYQEIGRCSRDGEPGECILFYGGQDVVTNQFFIDNNQDNQELDSHTREIVIERDQDRLRKMTFYSFTNDCLRDYILRYFGEYGSNYCGNCKNCLTQFKTVDITEIAVSFIECVRNCHQRYGINVIIDTLHGSNNAKIRQYQMDKNPQYGSLEKIPAYQLRKIINQLFLKEILFATADEYSIVKLGRNADCIKEGNRIIMKMAKDREREQKEKNKKKKVSNVTLTDSEVILFEELRNLRLAIAKEEKVPPYIVFSDKTLTLMCKIKPETKEEMLTVTGVGEFKYEKYGKRFIEMIKII